VLPNQPLTLHRRSRPSIVALKAAVDVGRQGRDEEEDAVGTGGVLAAVDPAGENTRMNRDRNRSK
jgi:hypothetical protein